MPVSRVAVVLAGVVLLAGCSQHAKVNRPVHASSLVIDSPSFPEPTATVSLPAPTSIPGLTSSATSTSPSVTIHPAPATPLRTATVDANGRHYVLKIWADVHNDTCADHAYGKVAEFLATHVCRGLSRQLVTTTVNGKAVGFDVAALSIVGTDAQHPYDNAVAFRALVEADGTGNVNDLLREGWRLPSGPTSLPHPDAFRTMAEDAGVNIYDMWYLAGPTPDNDPALLQLAADIYLAY